MRSGGSGEGPFLCDSSPFGCFCKGLSSDPWLTLPRPVVDWGKGVCSCEARCCCCYWAFPFGKNVFLFVVLCFPGKQSLVCICVCMHTQACTQCVYVEICRASQNHRRVASYLSNLPEIPLVTAFVLTLINPYFFYSATPGESVGGSLSVSQCF